MYLIINDTWHILQNLLASHDIVAQRDYLPKLRDVPVEVDEDEETVKLVQLVKSQEPLVSVPKYNGVICFNIIKSAI